MKTTTKKKPLIDEVETDGREALLAVESAMNLHLINRRAQIRALILAIISKHNILLEGPPGTAKTLTGALFASAVTGEFTFFKTQMLKSSLPEQLFGPINIGKMRGDNPTYEFHTEGMLPQAHLAIIEEVYRASEMVLSSMLTIFNEKLFHNGGKTIKCPLMTAIGTTNFVTQNEEIEAFNDRWLIRARVEPMNSASHRRQMYALALSSKQTLEADVSLTQIRSVQEAAQLVKLPDMILELYEQLVTKMIPDSVIALTDRRQVQILDLIKASAALNGRDEATPEDLMAAELGLTILGDTKSGSAFANAYGATVGNFERMKSESEELSALRDRMNKYLSVYSETMPVEKAEKLQDACRKLLNIMGQRSSTYVSNSNEEEYMQIMSRAEELLRDVAELLSKQKK